MGDLGKICPAVDSFCLDNILRENKILQTSVPAG